MSTLKVDTILKRTGTGTISIGQSGDTISVPTGAIFNASAIQEGGTNIVQGAKVADLWLLTSSFQGDASTITSNFSKVVSVTSNVTTESSGIFSFPLTGFYMVTWNVVIRLDSGNEKGNWYTRFTTDNSSYDFFSAPITMTSIGTNSYTSTVSQRIVDVTDTSLCKIKFGVDVSNTDTYTRGQSAPGETANRFSFIRLGDT
jgi:hypothetical protein